MQTTGMDLENYLVILGITMVITATIGFFLQSYTIIRIAAIISGLIVLTFLSLGIWSQWISPKKQEQRK